MRSKKNWILQLIGILIFVLILSKIDIKSTLTILKNTRLIYFIPALPLSFVLLLMKSYRWKYLLEKQGIKIFTVSEVFKIYVVGFYLSLLTPGKIGDFSKLFYLKDKGYSVGKSLVSILLDRIADVSVVGAVTFFGLLFLFSSLISHQLLLVVFGLLVFFILIKVFKKYPVFLKRIFLLLIPENWQKNLKNNFDDFISDFKKIIPKVYIFTAITTLICWLIFYFQIYLLALSLNIKITFLYVVLFTSILSVSSLIPISPGGTNIGTRDAILVFSFSALSIGSKELAIALSLLILFLIVIDGLIGMAVWFKMPLPLKIKKSDGEFAL